MSIVPFVVMLEQEYSTTQVIETADDRFYKTVFKLPGDGREYTVDFFDGRPVVLSWNTERGKVSLNSEGESF